MKKARFSIFILLAIALITTITMRALTSTDDQALAESPVETATAIPTTEPLATPPAAPIVENTATPLNYFEPYQLYVIGVGVNIREAPTTDSEQVGYRNAGDVITVEAEIDDWYKLSGMEQYIHKSLTTTNRDDIIPHVLENYSNITIIDISYQCGYCYADGKLLGTSDCVTGDAYNSPTPTGMYYVWDRCTDVDMYNDPQFHSDYAVYFNNLIAVHDADNWRGVYGGTIYKGNGSHGCVNAPRWFAKLVYENTAIGSPVLVIP